jgi:hypothetical protein
MLKMKSMRHGFTHAFNQNDEAHLRKLGWIGIDEKFPGEEVKEPTKEVKKRKPKGK